MDIYIIWSDFRNESSEQLSGLFLDPAPSIFTRQALSASALRTNLFTLNLNESILLDIEFKHTGVCYRIRVYRLSRGLETLSRSLIHRIRALELLFAVKLERIDILLTGQVHRMGGMRMEYAILHQVLFLPSPSPPPLSYRPRGGTNDYRQLVDKISIPSIIIDNALIRK